MVLYILLSGLPPFWAPSNEGIFEAIKEGTFNLSRPPWPSISEEAKDLVRRMLCKNPSQRITLPEILGQPHSDLARPCPGYTLGTPWVRPGYTLGAPVVLPLSLRRALCTCPTHHSPLQEILGQCRPQHSGPLALGC